MVTKEEIEKLAEMSRIYLPDSEKESLRKDIDGILSYVGQVKEVSDASTKSWEPAHRNILRKDVVTRKNGEYTESLLKSAPKNEKGYIKVKKIV